MNNKICIIVCFWGSWPAYLPFYVLAAARNSQVDFIIFTDNEKPDFPFPNISFIKLSINDFFSLSSARFGFPVQFTNPYKVCDFKPLYGFILQDYLKGYKYWGYSDLDIIFGDMWSFINEPLIAPVDVLSSYREFMAGPFSLYRNQTRINELFRLCPGYQKILRDEVYRSFDENRPRKSITGFSLPKLLFFLRFSTSYLSGKDNKPVTFKELRYQFQCTYKKHMTDQEHPADITEVVWSQALKKELDARFVPLLVTEPALHRKNIHDWSYRWESGKLTDLTTSKEVFAFHFQESKKRKDFTVPPEAKDHPFIITPKGIFYE